MKLFKFVRRFHGAAYTLARINAQSSSINRQYCADCFLHNKTGHHLTAILVLYSHGILHFRLLYIRGKYITDWLILRSYKIFSILQISFCEFLYELFHRHRSYRWDKCMIIRNTSIFLFKFHYTLYATVVKLYNRNNTHDVHVHCLDIYLRHWSLR